MTSYTLAVRGVKNLSEYQDLSESTEEFDLQKYVFDTGAYYEKEHEAIFSSWEPQEWRSHDSHMTIISEKYPNMIFELTCQEEDTFWREYYQDGQKETCFGEVIFEKPRKLDWDKLLVF